MRCVGRQAAQACRVLSSRVPAQFPVSYVRFRNRLAGSAVSRAMVETGWLVAVHQSVQFLRLGPLRYCNVDQNTWRKPGNTTMTHGSSKSISTQQPRRAETCQPLPLSSRATRPPSITPVPWRRLLRSAHGLVKEHGLTGGHRPHQSQGWCSSRTRRRRPRPRQPLRRRSRTRSLQRNRRRQGCRERCS